jgi:hypothetical protein
MLGDAANKTSLVDLVFSDRPSSPISNILDELLETMEDVEQVDASMILDAIAIRWLLADLLRGQGMPIEKIVAMETNPEMKAEVLND